LNSSLVSKFVTQVCSNGEDKSIVVNLQANGVTDYRLKTKIYLYSGIKIFVCMNFIYFPVKKQQVGRRYGQIYMIVHQSNL